MHRCVALRDEKDVRVNVFFNLMAGILIIYHSPVRPVKVKILTHSLP